MLLGDDDCYAALRARDARFDGQFFVGVSTTGIYCRPVCTARTPGRTRCRFFPSAAAAEREGFRPCLRCRPELAPGSASVDAVARLARAAATRIEDGCLTDASIDDLAADLGVTARHLRRVFEAEFGVSPIDYAQTQRLLLAKRLLTDTALPIIDVAMAAGFQSLRRFNALFGERYHLKPSELRRSRTERPAGELTFELGYRPPLAWEALLPFLGARTIDGVEAVGDGAYHRSVRICRNGAAHVGWLRAVPRHGRHTVHVTLSASLAPVVPSALAGVKRLFDLGCRPDEVAARLGPLAKDPPGLRVPGAFDGFEMAVRAILGQQVTVAAARTLAGRVARALGEPLATPFDSVAVCFPPAERFATVTVDDLGALGVPGARGRAILALASACATGELRLVPGVDVRRTIDRLVAVPGIGDWTAQYIAMRALAWPDAFPHTDYGVKKALGVASPRQVLALAEGWRPWRAYATLYLWNSLGTKETR